MRILFFACPFTFQLLPVLMTIAPALVRASILILFHPEFQKEDQTTVLQMRILQQVTIFSSLLSFPITFVSMCILDQYQKSLVISTLIILFWTLPPLVLYTGLSIAKKLKSGQHVHPGSIPKEPRHQHPHHPLLDPPPAGSVHRPIHCQKTEEQRSNLSPFRLLHVQLCL